MIWDLSNFTIIAKLLFNTIRFYNDVERAPDIDYERASLADIPAKLIDFDHIIYCQ